MRALRRRRRRRIKTGAAQRMATADSRDAHPATRPDAVAADRFVDIFGAGREIPALPAENGGKSQLIDADRAIRHATWGHAERAHFAGAAISAWRASICASASATASKVSKVEAWRAL